MAHYNRFKGFISHDHKAVPRHADEKSGGETPVEANDSLVFEHIFENAYIILVVEELAALFDAVEGGHHQVVGDSSECPPHHEQVGSVPLLPSHYVGFQVLVRRVESGMGRPASQRHQHPSLPEIKHFLVVYRHAFLVVYYFRYLNIAIFRIRQVLRVRFYVVHWQH